MDVPSLIDDFATGTYTLTRRATSGYTGGIANAPTNTTVSISASVQPANGRDLLRLPEGRRTQETQVVFSATELRVGGENLGYDADLITIAGRTWEVQQVQTWVPPGADPSDGVGYRALVQLKAEG